MSDSHKRTVILIGGAPTTGKSTIAKLLSESLNLPWISTDQIRGIMLHTVRSEDYPKLFNAHGSTAEQFLTKYSAEQIAQMEFDEGEAAWKGVKSFIENDYTWKDGFIVEGVNIIPTLIAKDLADTKNVHAVFLVDEDTDRTRDVVFTRGLWADAATYSDELKEKEVEWAMLFGKKLKAEAVKYGYPCVEVRKHDDDAQAVLSALKL